MNCNTLRATPRQPPATAKGVENERLPVNALRCRFRCSRRRSASTAREASTLPIMAGRRRRIPRSISGLLQVILCLEVIAVPASAWLVKLGWALIICGTGLAAVKFVVENFVAR